MKAIAALLILLSQLSNGPYTFTANAVTIPSRGVTIPAIFTVPRVAGKYPLVVIAHGHGGTKDENGGFTAIAETLAALGIAIIRMDFPGSGASTEPFIQNNLTNMIADVAAARAYAIASAPIDTKAIGIFGYSMVGEREHITKATLVWTKTDQKASEWSFNRKLQK